MSAPSDLRGRLTAFADITPSPSNGFSRLNDDARALVKEAADHIATLVSDLAEARRQRDDIGRAWDSADARAKEAEAERDALRAENVALADCLDCARLDWEGNNGEIIDKSDPHWTVEARRLARHNGKAG